MLSIPRRINPVLPACSFFHLFDDRHQVPAVFDVGAVHRLGGGSFSLMHDGGDVRLDRDAAFIPASSAIPDRNRTWTQMRTAAAQAPRNEIP
jgi:hypothetical protein